MPELPEVETICRGLADHVVGKRIIAVQLNRPDLRFPIPRDFAEKLDGAAIQAVRRRAKYLRFDLGDGLEWGAHLGMTGRFLYHARLADADEGKHDHLRIEFADGSGLIFNDARRFGYFFWIQNGHSEHLDALGPEPLSDDFSADYLYKATRGRKTPIKHWLMDQRRVVGVGNIYASEALFRAGIRPARHAGAVTKKEAEQLVVSVKQVLSEAIASGGSTLRDYVRSSGDVGFFQHRFAVYDCKGRPCPVCGAPIQHAVSGGRSTYWCATCQK